VQGAGAQSRFKSWGTSVPKASNLDAEGIDSETPKALRGGMRRGNREGYPSQLEGLRSVVSSPSRVRGRAQLKLNFVQSEC